MVRAIVLVAGVTFAFAEAIRGSVRICGLDADVVDGLGCVLRSVIGIPFCPASLTHKPTPRARIHHPANNHFLASAGSPLKY